MPPISALPALTACDHRTSPVIRSSPHTTPDFCAATRILRSCPPTFVSISTGFVPKSVSGLCGFRIVKTSPSLSCVSQASFPVSTSSAKIESEVALASSV